MRIPPGHLGRRGAALAESVAASRHYTATAAVLLAHIGLAHIGDAAAQQPGVSSPP